MCSPTRGASVCHQHDAGVLCAVGDLFPPQRANDVNGESIFENEEARNVFELPTPQASKTLTVRLPVAMYQQIADLARKQRRSLNNQLLVLLEQQLPSPLDEDQTTALPAPPYPHGRRPIALTYALGGTDAAAGN